MTATPLRDLVVLPRGGLGNRMRVLASAARLASLHDMTVRWTWLRSSDCGARFEDLFESVDGLSRASLIDLSLAVLRGRLIHRRSRGAFGALPAASRGGRLAVEAFNLLYRQADHLDGRPDIFDPRLAMRVWMKALKPRAELVAEAERFVARELRGPILGLHVRRTDNVHARARSTDEAFLRDAGELLARGFYRTIYLATDDLAVKRSFSERFGARLVSPSAEKAPDRSAASMRDALVEMLVLARSHTILGSYYSSYGEVASVMGEAQFLAAGGARESLEAVLKSLAS